MVLKREELRRRVTLVLRVLRGCKGGERGRSVEVTEMEGEEVTEMEGEERKDRERERRGESGERELCSRERGKEEG